VGFLYFDQYVDALLGAASCCAGDRKSPFRRLPEVRGTRLLSIRASVLNHACRGALCAAWAATGIVAIAIGTAAPAHANGEDSSGGPGALSYDFGFLAGKPGGTTLDYDFGFLTSGTGAAGSAAGPRDPGLALRYDFGFLTQPGGSSALLPQVSEPAPSSGPASPVSAVVPLAAFTGQRTARAGGGRGGLRHWRNRNCR
jgi:hypothetical protein